MRVLVVEDEADAARFLAKGLREHAYAVDTAADGAAGFEKACVNPYDVIVLDVILPDMDGFELCSSDACQKGQMAPVPNADGARCCGRVASQGLNAGADDYLTKPFDFQELLARLRALLRRRPRLRKSHASDCRPCRGYPSLQKVSRAGVPIVS